MYDLLLPNNENNYVFINGQLSNYPDIFSMPFTGMAIVHNNTKTVDIFFNCIAENEPSSRPAVYNYLTLQNICTEIGCSNLIINPPSTIVTLVRNNVDPGIFGRSGFKYNPYNGNGSFGGIARIYQTNLSVVGTWSLSDGGPNYYVIRQGDQYTFMILGAKMI